MNVEMTVNGVQCYAPEEDAVPAEVSDMLPVVPTLDHITSLEQAMIEAELPEGYWREIGTNEERTRHHFCAGLYARELDIPKGAVIVGKRHAKENFFVLTRGDLTVWTPDGMKRVKAPFMVVTRPGDKRVAYAHEDSTTINFHANEEDEKDVELLESKYIMTPRIGHEKTDLLEVFP